jgi:hypothetical protein
VGLYPADGLYLDDISINHFQTIASGLEEESLPLSFRLMAADGQWPVYLELGPGDYRDLELAYYLPNGQEILRQPLPVNANAYRISLPKIEVRGGIADGFEAKQADLWQPVVVVTTLVQQILPNSRQYHLPSLTA